VSEEILVIEMNPRVSRSSALASKATGFPIAKIAARLAVGYALEEIPNDITKITPASFEPTIDYVVVKWPRFAFEKFPGVNPDLSTHMKSVGEAMSIGRTFQQAFAKALRSRELDIATKLDAVDAPTLLQMLERPASDRYDVVLEAFRKGASIDDVRARTAIDPWFLEELRALALDPDAALAGEALLQVRRHLRGRVPRAHALLLLGPRAARRARGRARRARERRHPRQRPQPHRPGHRVRLLLRARRDDRPRVRARRGDDQLQPRDGLHRLRHLRSPVLRAADPRGRPRRHRDRAPEGVVVQFGGQTPLKLAHGLQEAGVPILGTTVDNIDLAEDRGRFGALLERLGYQAPPYATAHSVDEALERPRRSGFPLLVRPSYVLGGRAMEIVYSREGLADYLTRHARDGRAIYLDRFLENAIEVDVDALCDGEDVWIGGIMQHVEEAGIHSGDSACVLPPHSLGHEMLDEIRAATAGIALGLGVVGLMNVQYAVHGGALYVIEANPRASRTVPFVSKAIGIPLAKLACRIMLGERIADLALPEEPMRADHVSVKEAVLPFDRLEGSDAILGPEMRSTGEVMGIARDFPTAFAKAQAAAGAALPAGGTAFITLTDSDKPAAVGIAQILHDHGFRIVATRGTKEAIERMGIPATELKKVGEGRPTSSTGSRTARSTSWSTPRRARARARTAGRSGAPRSPAASRA
jgi:carbamoyl-phosphate synthase large subunit